MGNYIRRVMQVIRLLLTTAFLIIIGQHAIANSLYDCKTTNFVQVFDHDIGFVKSHRFEMAVSGRNVFLRCCPERDFHILKGDYETDRDWSSDKEFYAYDGTPSIPNSVISFEEPNFSLVRTTPQVTVAITGVCSLK